jgi:hypothetical protein
VNGYSGVYDGQAHGATGTATGVMSEDLSALMTLGDKFTNVPGGTATWSFAGNVNYKTDGGTVEIVLSKADAVIAVNGYSGIYDGQAHGATATATGVNGENLYAGLKFGQSFVDVPGGTANWTFDGGTNYTEASGHVAIVIEKAKAVISVNGYTGVYDGQVHGATGSASGVTGENLGGLLSLGSSFTDVPGGTAAWQFSGNINYQSASGSVHVAITKADATIQVDGFTGVYDGKTHYATGTAVGVNKESLSGLLNLGAGFCDVPGGTAYWTFAGTTNYNTASGHVGIVIAKVNATISVIGYSGVYDGNAHGATGTATGVNGENLTALLSRGATFTNVPGGNAEWTFAGTTNYNSASGTIAILIAKADQTIAWSTPAPVAFGTPLGAAQLNAVVTKGDGSLSYSPAAGTILPVGTAMLTTTAAETANYKAASRTVQLTVNPWYLTGFYNPVTMGGPSVVNTVRGGSTVPLKFNIFVSNGGSELNDSSDVVSFQVVAAGCSAETQEDPVDFTTTGGTSLRYDTTARQFIQNWQTPKTAGACYRVTMTARDGSTITAFFKTK